LGDAIDMFFDFQCAYVLTAVAFIRFNGILAKAFFYKLHPNIEENRVPHAGHV
jgi:hypothetical protein